MKIQSLKLVYFSPTGTTKSVVQAVARGLNQLPAEQFDLTLPEARNRYLETTENDLIVAAVPVYMGRVPALLNGWLSSMKACNTPAVCIVVYGNRVYDDALLELKNILKERGCIPLAGAAFIGEHSFSGAKTPIAVARPDANDLVHAEAFGRSIYEILPGFTADYYLDVPGVFPYRGITELWNVDFIKVSEACTQCGHCAEICPVDAVNHRDSHRIDEKKCITCCACIKNCPQNARSMKPGLVKNAAERLSTLYSERKEPACFF